MIRHAKPTDLPALKQVAEGTKMFLGDELDSFLSEMRTHLEAPSDDEAPSATLVVSTDSDQNNAPVTGAAYFMPEVMAQGVVNLLFIGVLPERRNCGHGQAMLDHFESTVREARARLAIIETASDTMFAPAWALYKRAGYDQEARVRDFYDDGLDKLVFRKRL